MDKPKPLGELLYCTLQNLYYHSIQQQEWLLKNGQRPRLFDNCTINLSGPRQAGFSWALEQFLLNDCEKAIVVFPTLDMANRIRNKPNNDIRKRGHIFGSVESPSMIKGYSTNTVIFSNYSLMEQTKRKKLEFMEQCLIPVIATPPEAGEYRTLIRLH